MEGYPTFKGSWNQPWIGSYCIPSCITHWPLLTTKFHWNQRNVLWMNGQTYGLTNVWDPLYYVDS